MKVKDHKIWPLPDLEISNKITRFFFQPIKEALGSQAACDTEVLWKPGFLWIVLDEYKTEGMCSSTVHRKPSTLMYVPDCFKTQEICDKTVTDDSFYFQFVSDWFITKEWIDMWYDDMMMMVIIGMMIKIIFLSGKTQSSKSLNKRRALTHCLAPIKVLRLLCVRRWKKRDRKIVGINIDLFCSWWQDTKKFFDPKRTKNKDVFCVEYF